MWLMTTVGFFSIVQKPEDRKTGDLTVRARVRSDLERLRDQFLPSMGPIKEHAGTDYRFRAKAPKGDVAVALANIATKLDYPNFKDEVAKRQGKARASAYGKVWNVLYQLQDDATGHAEQSGAAKAQPAAYIAANGKDMAFGGVLIDARQRVLLRQPTGDFDGYVWTFPKGRPDPGESAEQAALREVRQETGYDAVISGKLPEGFEGGTTVTEFFLMTPKGKPGKFDEETVDIKWVTLAEAASLIAMTTNKVGKKRDLAVLKAVRDYLGM
jgi:8-oxo-dGTP pyrophosphatase MutT (NUDIX family)